MKVMIADDELKVCRLIKFLVNWESLGMEIVSVVHNGIDALNVIQEQKPDIVITDIRMPGCDGLSMIERMRSIAPDIEYIVISGYRDFEYAHKAIHFGVSNYLLKPISQEELTDSLKKIRENYLEKTEQLSKDERLKNFEKDDIQRARIQIFEKITTTRNLELINSDLSQINSQYKYTFQNGIFQIICIKVDGIKKESEKGEIYLEEKINQILKVNLSKCYEWESFFEEHNCYILLNYNSQEYELRRSMRKILEELLLQQNVLKGISVTIGIGNEKKYHVELNDSFKTAKWAIAQRLLVGNNRIIIGENRNANKFADSEFFKSFNKEFNSILELQDVDEVGHMLLGLGKDILEQEGITGYQILQMAKEAINAYIFVLKNNNLPMDSTEGMIEKFNLEVQDCGTVKEIFEYLNEIICSDFQKVLEKKNQMNSRPVREAQKYLTMHYKEPVSLEIVSEVVGFNSAYFSSMFKKEVGIGFAEYLLSVRMEKTKELLKETKKSVTDICCEVGYSDIKYFTKKFIQYTSLKPNEYRKLYS